MSKERLYQSFLDGLNVVDCESMRGEIWKFLCKVPKSKSQFSCDVYKRLLSQSDPKVEKKIEKDIHRTVPDSTEYSESAISGNNRLYNILKAYSIYDPDVGYC